MTTFNLTADVIDIRDLIERFEHLEGSGYGLPISGDACLISEFKRLESILDELSGNGDDEQWRGDWYPVTLIKDSYFVEYTKDLIEDCYSDINTKSTDWPYRHMAVDYVAAADELKDDYTYITIGESDYWYR